MQERGQANIGDRPLETRIRLDVERNVGKGRGVQRSGCEMLPKEKSQIRGRFYFGRKSMQNELYLRVGSVMKLAHP